jgi:hypothetical protein
MNNYNVGTAVYLLDDLSNCRACITTGTIMDILPCTEVHKPSYSLRYLISYT